MVFRDELKKRFHEILIQLIYRFALSTAIHTDFGLELSEYIPEITQYYK